MDRNSKQILKYRLDWREGNKMCMMILFFLFAMSTYCSKSKEEPFMKTFGGSGPDRGIHIIQTTDGNFVIVGNTMTETNKLDVYLIKCNSSGDTLWTKTYGGQEDDNIAWSIAISQDDEYIIAAQTNSFGQGELDAYLIKTDAFGDTLWTKTFGGPKVDRVFSVDLADDGSILLAGITYSYGAGDRDAYLIKTGRDGMLLWQNTYGGAENDRAMTVFQLQDGGYILTGFTQSFGEGDWDAYVVKTGAKGDTLWTGTYGTPAPDFGYDIIQGRKGNYYITGWSHGLVHPEGDLLLIKTNH